MLFVWYLVLCAVRCVRCSMFCECYWIHATMSNMGLFLVRCFRFHLFSYFARVHLLCTFQMLNDVCLHFVLFFHLHDYFCLHFMYQITSIVWHVKFKNRFTKMFAIFLFHLLIGHHLFDVNQFKIHKLWIVYYRLNNSSIMWNINNQFWFAEEIIARIIVYWAEVLNMRLVEYVWLFFNFIWLWKT